MAASPLLQALPPLQPGWLRRVSICCTLGRRQPGMWGCACIPRLRLHPSAAHLQVWPTACPSPTATCPAAARPCVCRCTASCVVRYDCGIPVQREAAPACDPRPGTEFLTNPPNGYCSFQGRNYGASRAGGRARAGGGRGWHAGCAGRRARASRRHRACRSPPIHRPGLPLAAGWRYPSRRCTRCTNGINPDLTRFGTCVG